MRSCRETWSCLERYIYIKKDVSGCQSANLTKTVLYIPSLCALSFQGCSVLSWIQQDLNFSDLCLSTWHVFLPSVIAKQVTCYFLLLLKNSIYPVSVNFSKSSFYIKCLRNVSCLFLIVSNGLFVVDILLKISSFVVWRAPVIPCALLNNSLISFLTATEIETSNKKQNGFVNAFRKLFHLSSFLALHSINSKYEHWLIFFNICKKIENRTHYKKTFCEGKRNTKYLPIKIYSFQLIIGHIQYSILRFHNFCLKFWDE